CWGADIFDSFLEMAGNSLNKLSRLFFSIFGECGNNIKADCNQRVPLNHNRAIGQLRDDSKPPKKTSFPCEQKRNIPDSTEKPLEIKSRIPLKNQEERSEIGRLNPKNLDSSAGRNQYLWKQNQKPQPSADQLENDITKLKTKLSEDKSKLSKAKLKFHSAIQSDQDCFKQFKSEETYGIYQIDQLSKKIDDLSKEIDDLNEKIIRKELVLQELYPNDFEEYQKKLPKEFDEEIFHMELH
ncbi:MAG: hypothetical protein JSR93_07295, partial [Verrucomicrobia bacterium]|nr:hypothetical protein [Verrucomicrobiota bacterium]